MFEQFEGVVVLFVTTGGARARRCSKGAGGLGIARSIMQTVRILA
jgi:hypothetical protein